MGLEDRSGHDGRRHNSALLERPRRHLGGTLRDDRPDFGTAGAWINLGTQQVRLVEAPVPPNVAQDFAIRVDDLDTVVDELRSKGLDVGNPVSVGPNRQALVNDPAGNVVELHQVGATRS